MATPLEYEEVKTKPPVSTSSIRDLDSHAIVNRTEQISEDFARGKQTTVKLQWDSLRYRRTENIQIHNRTYRLLPNVVCCVRESNGEWIATLLKKGHAPLSLVQHGGNETEAINSLYRKVDTLFQQLYKTHAMQRDPVDEANWKAITGLIDVAEYRSRMTAVHEIYARVSERTEDGSIVLESLGGRGCLSLTNDTQSGDWQQVQANDWVIAVIEKVVNRDEVVRATLLRRAAPPKQQSEHEFQELYSSIKPADLPASDDDPF